MRGLRHFEGSMNDRRLLRVVLAALAVLLLFVARASAAAPAKQVYAGVYLHDVTKFDQKDGVFDVDLELWAKWLGDFDPDKLRIANSAAAERTLLGQEADGEWRSARWRVRGTLRGEFPLQRFPFDRQTLGVVLELPESEGKLVPDLAGSGMRERFSVTGWLYDPVFSPSERQGTYRSDLGSIAHEGKPTPVRRVAFEVTLSRPLLMAGTKLFLPLAVILLVALIALAVHPKWLDVRSGVGVTALLACFAFQFSVADTMPNVSYMTIADTLFLVAYALTAVLLCISVLAAHLHDRGLPKGWKWLDIGSCVVLPIVLVITLFVTIGEPSAPAPAPVAKLGGERPKSERPLVRIGIDQLATPLGGLAGRGSNWGTVRTELDGTRIAALVEQVPSITNDSLRFLADGSLEVTWRLREGLSWSDGKPLTAEDLEFALQVSPDPRIVESRVASVRELVVRYNDRVAVALESITPLPKHALEAAFKKGGYDAVREHRRTNVLPSAGPYRVVEFKLEDHVFLEANKHFAGPPPSIKRIEIRRYPDDAALVRAFEEGQIDLIAPNAISPEAAKDLATRKPDAVKIRPSEILTFIHPDLGNPLLSPLEARRALLMAIDREKLGMETFGDAARVAHVPVPGKEPQGTTVIGFDLEGARKLFEAHGLVGKKIPLFHGPTPVDRAVAKQIVADVAAAGVTLEPNEVKKLNDLYRKRKHGGLLLSSTTGERDSQPEKYWSLPQVGGKYDRKWRSVAYTNEIAELVEREERALYDERREQIRDLLFVEFSKRLPNLPILFLADRIAAVPDLEGWTQGSGINFGTTIERWHFAKPVALR
jgi:peptide/nickel transport system substrate-binding protein